jgi:hypothetical protein
MVCCFPQISMSLSIPSRIEQGSEVMMLIAQKGIATKFLRRLCEMVKVRNVPKFREALQPHVLLSHDERRDTGHMRSSMGMISRTTDIYKHRFEAR